MTIEEIRKKYADGDIDVKSYALQMFKKYEELFCYQELLEKSKVKEKKKFYIKYDWIHLLRTVMNMRFLWKCIRKIVRLCPTLFCQLGNMNP